MSDVGRPGTRERSFLSLHEVAAQRRHGFAKQVLQRRACVPEPRVVPQHRVRLPGWCVEDQTHPVAVRRLRIVVEPVEAQDRATSHNVNHPFGAAFSSPRGVHMSQLISTPLESYDEGEEGQEALTEESLIEEVSIDGMCGVY